MADILKKHYSCVKRTVSISNAAVLNSSTDLPKSKMGFSVIGFISNISFEKGIREFIDVAEQLSLKEIPVTSIIAGPFQDSTVESYVRNRLLSLPLVKYIGPVYGQNKVDFYGTIDVLVFPSNNEAEPLTILEALQYGIPTIAFGYGCIPTIIPLGGGLVIEKNDDFTEQTFSLLCNWFNSPELYKSAATIAHNHFIELRNTSADRLNKTIKLIIGSYN
jgi:glycosyltransferase involved in cell wall biosynthesis